MQWHTPIGYCVRDGQIVVDERQSDIVRQIFADYDSGISATQIAHTLMEQGVMNKHDRVKWTHATVGRILENHNYLGTEYYPCFIDKELFHRVQEKREQKRQNLCQGIYGKIHTRKVHNRSACLLQRGYVCHIHRPIQRLYENRRKAPLSVCGRFVQRNRHDR